jgi:hypothetical protein
MAGKTDTLAEPTAGGNLIERLPGFARQAILDLFRQDPT